MYVNFTSYHVSFATLLTEHAQPNILINDDNNAVLCDFGLASITADAESAHASTVNSAGSIRWMAPERLSIFDGSSEPAPNSLRVTKESDMYSLAMVVIEVRTTLPQPVIALSLIPARGPVYSADIHRKPSVLGHSGCWRYTQARSTKTPEETRGCCSTRVDESDLGNR